MSLIETLLKESIYKLSDKDMKYILDNAKGFNERSEAEEFLNYKLSNVFPDGVVFNTDSVWLYRIIFLSNSNNLNENGFGEHWTAIPDNIDDEHWVELIRDTTNNYHDKIEIVLIAEFDIKNIDVEHTLANNVRYPNEDEFTLYSKNINPKQAYIVNRKKFNYKNPLQSKGIKKIK